MALVVDASVALKWVLPEPETERALALIESDRLIAPDFLYLECANVLARDVRRGVLPVAAAEEALAALQGVALQVSPILDLIGPAYGLATALGQTVYDCLYLALAQAEGAVLVTADRRFAEACAERFADAVRLI